VDNKPCKDPQTPLDLKGKELIKIGKKRFFKIVL
jgi:hypothetical protein